MMHLHLFHSSVSLSLESNNCLTRLSLCVVVLLFSSLLISHVRLIFPLVYPAVYVPEHVTRALVNLSLSLTQPAALAFCCIIFVLFHFYSLVPW